MTSRLSVVIVVLACVLGCRVWLNGYSSAPPRQSLDSFPSQLGDWHGVQDSTLTPEMAEVMRADDYLWRSYRSSSGAQVQFFAAYFRSQRAGETMHSPKNCLPGSGWQPVLSDEISADLGTGKPETVSRYVVEQAGSRMLVLYWYQAHGRVIANEYLSKIYLVWDAIRLRRRDGAIVRLTAPVPEGESADTVTRNALQLAKAAAPSLPAFLPN